jgi:hypothetical protein
MHTTPRNGISIPTIPKRCKPHDGHDTKSMGRIMDYLQRIDTVYEHADALMGANGLQAEHAYTRALTDLLKAEREACADSGNAAIWWDILPSSRKAIIARLKEA